MKMFLIAALCGFVVFLICASLLRLIPLNSDAAGNAMTAGFHYLFAIFIGIVIGIVVLVMQLKGASIKSVIVVSLIPVALFITFGLLALFSEYAYDKYREKARTMDNPFNTTEK
jgi:hypothetical protein